MFAPKDVESHLGLYAAACRGPAVGIHVVVPKELPSRAVELVRASLNADVNHRAGAAAVRGRIAVAQDAKLFHCIDRGTNHIHALPAEAGGV
jgi:hypothetical protein